MTVSNRKGPANRVLQTIFQWRTQRGTWASMRLAKTGDDTRPVTEDSALQDVREERENCWHGKNRKVVKLYTPDIGPSIACGVEEYGLSPTDLKQFRNTAAACSAWVEIRLAPSLLLKSEWDSNTILPSQRASAFSLGGSACGMRTGSCTNLFRRHGIVSLPHSESPSVAGGLYTAHVQRCCNTDGLGLDPT